MDVPTAAEALKSLTRILAETGQHGYLYFEYEARLALGEAEIRSGRGTAGRFRLATLERDSRASGFLRIARKASRAHDWYPRTFPYGTSDPRLGNCPFPSRSS
jgi:hypothetical protein